MQDETGQSNCQILYNNYQNTTKNKVKAKILDFSYRKKLDFYNPSKIYELDGKKIIAVRAESRGTDTDSRIKFFSFRRGAWRLVKGAPILYNQQDPFYAGEIQGWKVLGTVAIDVSDGEVSALRTVFYKFKNEISELEKFAIGPNDMKDIRLIDLKNGQIGVFTRPRGGVFGKGRIGFMRINSLDELQESLKRPDNAQIIDGVLHGNEWGGVNDLHLLSDSKIGVIGHVAFNLKTDSEDKNYYATSWVYDFNKNKVSNLKVIASADILDHERKWPKLQSVVFPGGSVRRDDGMMDLYAGLGDTCSVHFELPDPFEEALN